MDILNRIAKYLLIPLITSLELGYAQNKSPNVDSLLKEAEKSYGHDVKRTIYSAQLAYTYSLKEDNILIELKSLKLIAISYAAGGDFKNAYLFAAKGLKFAQKNKIDSLIGIFWETNGYIDYVRDDYDAAVINYKNAIKFYKKDKLEKKIGNTYLDLGILEQKRSKFETANDYYFKSADKFLKIKDTSDLAGTYNSIALCYVSLKNYQKALQYNKKALTIRKNLNDNALVAQTLNNIGFAFKEQNQPDSSIFYLSECLMMRSHVKDSSILVLTLQNLGSCWKIKGNFQKAESYILRSLTIATNYGMKEELAKGNLDLAELYTAQKRYKEALTAVKITENTAKALKLPELLMNAYAAEFNLYRQQGDYKDALVYDTKRDAIKDTLLTIAKDKAINELEIKYQTNLKEKDIIALNLQNKLQSKTVGEQRASIIALIIAAILLLALFAITYNNFRIKNIANARIQLLMKDLHHRVKNNLQILSSLFTMQIDSLNDENTKNALRENESRLASMNLIHSKLYMDNTTTEIEMQEYLTKLLHHIKGSFGGDRDRNITLNVDIEPLKIEADKAVAVGLIVNELTTNSFKYAFDDTGGEIFLSLKQPSKSKLLLTIGDNGKGMPDAYEKKSSSFGLKLVKLMARQLSSELKVKNDNGTVYKMEIGV